MAGVYIISIYLIGEQVGHTYSPSLCSACHVGPVGHNVGGEKQRKVKTLLIVS